MEANREKSPMVVLMMGVLVASAVVAALYARANLADSLEDKMPLSVDTRTISRTHVLTIDQWFSGRVEPSQQVLIASELAGKVTLVSAQEGDTVRQGQLLVTLDTSLLSSDRKRLAASLDGLTAQDELARKRLKRQKDLQSSGFAAADAIDEIETNLKLIAAQRSTVGAELERIDIQIAKSEIRSPFDAQIQARLVDVGAVINPGTAMLNVVESGIGEIKVGVPVDIANSIEVGDRHSVEVRGDQGLAEVISIAPAVDPVTQTVAVRLIINDIGFRFGEFVNLKLSHSKPASGFWVPNSALVEDERGLWSVFSVNRDNIVTKLSVTLLHADNEQVFVGIDDSRSHEVIVSGLNRIAPGMRVEF